MGLLQLSSLHWFSIGVIGRKIELKWDMNNLPLPRKLPNNNKQSLVGRYAFEFLVFIFHLIFICLLHFPIVPSDWMVSFASSYYGAT